MLNFKELLDAKFSLLEAVRVYKDMVVDLAIPIIQMALLSAVFILFGQALLSLLPKSVITNIIFWIWVAFVFCLSTATFFKISEDIILSKAVQIYENIAHTIVLSTKLFAVLGLIFGALVILITPMFYITNPLFALPYKALAIIFIIAAIPFVYFAPLAVVLREANILNSFTFSYYMVLQRWWRMSQIILTQIIFTLIIAFWAYFIVSLLFFPNSPNFFDFIFTKATALSEQFRDLYIRFVFWEIMQVFVLTTVTAVFVGINTILFLYFEGTLTKIIEKKNEIKINRTKAKKKSKIKFVDVLANSKPVTIDTTEEKEEIHHKTREEVLDEIYPGYQESKEENKSKSPEPTDDVIILEDEYPQ